MKSSIKLPSPFISGSMLKLIAMVTMFIDHFASYILSQTHFYTDPIFSIFGKGVTLYFICRKIGRLAFPLYCFLLTEGFIYTKDRKKYGIRLFIFALISEFPWNFAHTGSIGYLGQNVMFTLFLGYLGLCALEYFDKDVYKQSISLIVLFIICSGGMIDYGVRGLGLILIIYLFRQKPAVQAVLGSSVLGSIWPSFAFIPINLYNKKRGFMSGAFGKYIGYLFYPVHLLLLGTIRYYLINR